MPEPFGRDLLLLERIALGGMAEVFRAKTFGVEGFERLVAIKRILPSLVEDEEFIKMFIDEARIAAHLTHQNVVQIFDLGRHEELYYISMEYVAGRDLRLMLDFFKKIRKPMELGMACFLVSRVCEALDYAHRKRDATGKHLKIIHRDVSPQNVMVSYEGEVKLCDFGIVKAATQSTRTQAGVLKGKFAYMSPEQVRGRPMDRRSDLFALGAIFYEMLTTERLFLAESDYATLENVREARVKKPRVYNSEIPPALERIVMKLLAREPERRYQWASEVFEDLYEFMASTGRLFHVRHLRQFMQDTYARDIQVENAKLESFKDLKRVPEPAEPTADFEDPGTASAVAALAGQPNPFSKDEPSVSALLQSAAEGVAPEEVSSSQIIPLEPEVMEVEGRPSEERATSSNELPQPADKAGPGAGVFDGLLHEATASPSFEDPADEGTQEDFSAEDQELGTVAEERGADGQPVGPAIRYSAREDALRSELSDPPSLDDESTHESFDSEIATSETPMDDLPAIEPSALGDEDDDRTEARLLPHAGSGARTASRPRDGAIQVRPVQASLPPLGMPASHSASELGSNVEIRSVRGLLADTDPKILGLAAAALGLVLLSTILLVALMRGPDTASLSVETSPVTAVEVFLDGERVAETTPLVKDGLELGAHVIELRADGYEVYRQEFELAEPRPHTLSIPLAPRGGGDEEARGP